MTRYEINLHEAISSLSNALDLVGVEHIHHGKRVAFIASECGQQMGWSKPQLDNLLQAAILHDCGVSKTTVHARLAQFDWELEDDHCKIGAALLNSSEILKHLSPYVLYHHTHWPEVSRLDIPEEVKLIANCIYMSDRMDVLTVKFLASNKDILLGKETIRNKIREKRYEWFNPYLVEAMMEVSDSEAFWFSLENNHIEGYLAKWLTETPVLSMNFEELRSLVMIFSIIVDAKSPFTKEHSHGVANLARYLGSLFNFPEATCEKLELAGLLHYIGKLRVPDELLEKMERLSEEENLVMRRHSFDTFNILKNIKGLEDVSLWAAQHHERLDGSGYPFRPTKKNFTLEARIVAAADVFQALAQDRPYRSALDIDHIIDHIRELGRLGKLDDAVVAQILAHPQECWKVATQTG